MSWAESVAAAVLTVGAALVAPAGTVSAPAAESAEVKADATLPAGRGWAWPLDPQPSVLRAFDPPDQPWLAGHRGVDLGAVVGAVVRSPADGRVSFSGRIAGRGVVVVTHVGNLRSTFEPVESGPPVGARVGRAEPIGVLAATVGHCAPATCLHWGVLRGETYLDPLAFVGHAPIILLPLH